MTETIRTNPRVLVGAVSLSRSRTMEEAAKVVSEEVVAANFKLVRNVVVTAEAQFIQQLVSNVSNDNEADAIILVGSTGFGPRDSACEALNGYMERNIEGFAEAYRQLLREDLDMGSRAWMCRASAGVYNRCLVFAMTGRTAAVRRAMQRLIVPALADAVDLATGKLRAFELFH